MNITDRLPRHIANHYKELTIITLKIQRKAASIGFIHKCIHNKIIPKFAKLKGQFTSANEKLKAERHLLVNHILQHKTELKELCIRETESRQKLETICGGKNWLYRFISNRVHASLRKSNITSFKTKNKKINILCKQKKPDPAVYEVPVINLSDVDVDIKELRKGLNYCFIDKNKFVKVNLAAEFEMLAEKVDKSVIPEEKENFHNFLRKQTNLFSNNILNSNDSTYNSLKSLIRNKNIVILSGDKDSSVVIMNRVDYENKINDLIRQGEIEGKYVEVQDSIHGDLKRFQDFLKRNLGKPISQPVRNHDT